MSQINSLRKKIFLKGPYFPKHADNLMEAEGDVVVARKKFIEKRFRNLDFLLRQRYEWMNAYLKQGDVVIEVGAGAGFSPLYLKYAPILTDAVNNSWIEKYLDAINMDIESNSVDILIASHNIHHFYSPYKFFEECSRVLKINGILLIQEINTSLLMRLLLRIMRHEGWSYEINVFDKNTIANNPSDLWSANCAVPELLFGVAGFEKYFPSLKVEVNDLCEGLIFPLSGGVISKKKMVELPEVILKSVQFFDTILVHFFPNIFALGRRVVIRKVA